MYGSCFCLVGILHLDRITDNSVSGSAIQNFQLVQKSKNRCIDTLASAFSILSGILAVSDAQSPAISRLQHEIDKDHIGFEETAARIVLSNHYVIRGIACKVNSEPCKGLPLRLDHDPRDRNKKFGKKDRTRSCG